VALAKQVVGEIGALPQDLPVYLDISTADRWVSEAEAVLSRLAQLIETAEFRRVNREDDWAVPLRGPAAIDLVQLLEDQDIDPLDHVDPDVVALRWFLFLRWAIEGEDQTPP
jgi:hypothetical protein